jgi:RHS repeat-associated protein
LNFNFWGHDPEFRGHDPNLPFNSGSCPQKKFRSCPRNFTRDTLGRVTSVSGSNSDSAFAYDASTGFVTSSSYQALKHMAYPLAIDYSFQYDGNGNIMNSTVRQQNASGGLAMSEQFAYDPLDRVTSASVIPESGASFAYDAAGRPVSITRLNGVSTSFSYDPADRLSAISESHPQLPNEKYVKRNITRNPLGFISSVSDSLDGDTAFSYDTMNRLTAAARPDALSVVLPDESYSYSSDGLGHRTASVTGGSTDPQTGAPVQVDYTVDTQTDQLREDSLYTYTYDTNGNRTERESKSDGSAVKYQYDVFDRLVSVKKYTASDANNPESEVNYKYDWSGRLIEKSACHSEFGGHDPEFGGHDPNLPLNSGSCPQNSNTTTTRYEYSGLNLIAELDGENNLLASYQHAPGTIDMPISMRIGDKTFYYHYDELGSVVKITNSGGQIVQTYRYDSFGRIVLQEGDMHNPFTYTGRLWDADAELYHYRARVYDPDAGVFLQQDPVFSVNPYAYVNNDPVNYTDPLGMCVNDGKGGRYTYDAYVAGKQLCNSETCWIGCPMSWEQYRDRCHAEGGSFGASPGVIYAIWVPPYRCVKCTPISIPMDCEKSCRDSNNAAKCSSGCYKALGKVLDSPNNKNGLGDQTSVPSSQTPVTGTSSNSDGSGGDKDYENTNDTVTLPSNTPLTPKAPSSPSSNKQPKVRQNDPDFTSIESCWAAISKQVQLGICQCTFSYSVRVKDTEGPVLTYPQGYSPPGLDKLAIAGPRIGFNCDTACGRKILSDPLYGNKWGNKVCY